MYTLASEKKLSVIASLLEGNSVRSTERMTGVHRDTICRLLVQVGNNCSAIWDAHVRNVHAKYVQADEIWCYVGKKDKHVRIDDPEEFGNQWVFVAMDEETKFIPSFLVGKRTRQTTYEFLIDLQQRLADTRLHRFQLTTDGFHFYTRGVEDVFAGECDFAQLIKLFGDWNTDTSGGRYSPPRIAEVISKIRDGRPDEAHICTSHVERQNLTMRMCMRRFTRLTNAFSKKLENLKAACSLHFAHYNFCRVHSSLRVTPAMAAGITSRIWEIGELIA
jgi:IS1 family transposase